MSDVNWLQVVLRWLHIIPAITLLGGTIFMAFAMHPALGATITDAGQRESVRAAMAKRWKMVVHLCVLLLLGSGMYNFITYEASAHEPTYHMIFGIKFLLALVVFFFAEAMVGKAKVFEAVRRNAGTMLLLMSALGIVIVLISGVMKNFPLKEVVTG